MYIMAPEPISTAYLTNPSKQSVCLYVYSPIVDRQRLSKHVLAAMNTRKNRIVRSVVFYMVHVISKEMESLWVCVSPILVNIPLKCWSEGSQSCQTVK
jgi:hypothetical protein